MTRVAGRIPSVTSSFYTQVHTHSHTHHFMVFACVMLFMWRSTRTAVNSPHRHGRPDSPPHACKARIANQIFHA